MRDIDDSDTSGLQAIDNLEEVFENPEQIEISKYFERLPKPTLIALQEMDEDEIYHRINEEIEPTEE